MSKTKRITAGAVAGAVSMSALAIGAVGAGVGLTAVFGADGLGMGSGGIALAQDANATAQSVAMSQGAEAAQVRVASHVQPDEVQGTFSFTQNALSTNEEIAGTFRKTTAVLCSSPYYEVSDLSSWDIEVSGDVATPYAVSLADLAQESGQTSVMTCACSNNGAGGAAIINAQVSGVKVTELAARAGIDPAVNAVRFTAADGMQNTLPLTYLMAHGATIAYAVNGEGLDQSVGGTNQLWIESSAGRHFTRDIVSVEFLALDEAPAEPSLDPTEYEYVNRPNVSAELGASPITDELTAATAA